MPLSDPDQLSTEVLLRLALREVDGDADEPMPFLIALHRRSVREVFNAAAALVEDSVPVRRELGVRILRELGEQQLGRRRPFSAETIVLLRARLRDEPDSGVRAWIVSALGYHCAREALPEVLALAAHPDRRVRFHVAAALPCLVDPVCVEPDAEAVLIRLCQDEDPDTRYYALYAATREIGGMNAEAMTDLTGRLMEDPEDQIRMMAAAHHTALGDVRRLLTEWDLLRVVDPASNTDAYDCMTGSLLAGLDQDMDAPEIRHLLDDEIRRCFRLSPAGIDTPSMAERLVTWWRAERWR